MNTPNKSQYVSPQEYATCPRCKVTQRADDLKDGACSDLDRCVRWQVEAKVREATGARP